MTSSRQKLLAMELSAMAAPVILVLIGRTLLAGPPPIAIVVQVKGPALAAAPAASAKPLTPEQLKAAEWVRAMPEKLELATPLNHPTEVVKPVQVTVESPKVAPSDPTAGLKLSSIMGRGTDQIASISGKIHRIGDEVRPGLKLTAIDAATSTITLTDAAGKSYQLKRGR